MRHVHLLAAVPLLIAFAHASVAGCGGATASIPDGGADASGSSGGSSSGTASSSGSSSGNASSSGSSSGGSSSGVSSSSGSSSGGSSSGSTGVVPTNHRPSDAQCQTTPAAGDCQLTNNPNLTCTKDSQCTSGTDGRCVMSGGPVEDCLCTYDACMHDTDCNKGEVCACHGSPYVGGYGNACVQGDCRVDSDCGPAGYCSPAYDTNSCGGLLGYYCHTAADQCVNDTDCQSQAGYDVCTFIGSRWQCAAEELCP